MANSMATISRKLYRSLLSSNPKMSQLSMPFCTATTATTTTDNLSSHEEYSDLDLSEALDSDTESVPNSTTIPISSSSSSSSSSTTTAATTKGSTDRRLYDRPLENGLDVGVYKAILVGKVGQKPMQRTLSSGMQVTIFSLGTGGIRNNRRPLQNEDPREYANRCAVLWHRVAVYRGGLGHLVMQNIVAGSLVYAEGNLETNVFTDPVTGLVRRIRQVAIRRNGRIVFLGNGGDEQASASELKGLGYY